MGLSSAHLVGLAYGRPGITETMRRKGRIRRWRNWSNRCIRIFRMLYSKSGRSDYPFPLKKPA